MFFLILILKEILPLKYYNHWKLFSYCMTILSQYQIQREFLPIIQQSLEDFVRQTESLYGKRAMRINVHQLLHLYNDILNWGLLWTHNSFSYESMNGVLARLIHGTKDFPKSAIQALVSLHQLPLKEFQIKFTTNEATILFAKLKKESFQ
jgi:hypothetical protein